MAKILEMFDWYSTSRLVVVIGCFEHQVEAGNICFDLKQLIKVLHCDLQVTIHKGLVEVQADILEVIANFVDNFHSEVTALSAP